MHFFAEKSLFGFVKDTVGDLVSSTG